MGNRLFELAARRRSVRRNTDEHIDEHVIDEIMKVALTAPASFGHQPVEFVVVRDKQTIRDIKGDGSSIQKNADKRGSILTAS